MYTQNINLNMDTGKYNLINVKQNDSGRKIIVSLFKNNAPFINSFQNTKIFFKRSDNRVYFNTVSEVKDNQVIFELTNEILRIIGELEVEIAFYENTSVMTSIVFKIGILRSIRDESVVDSINKNDAIADILVKLDAKANKEYVDNLVTNIQTGGVDLTDYAKKTDLPTKVSQLDNNSNFLTAHQDISGKVDKVAGKGLSTNDYSTIEKTKLSKLNNYDDTLIKNSITLKADKTYVDQKLANLSGGGTIDLSDYVLKTQIASATQNGLMSLGDKIKLDTLQNYVHPENHPISIITGLQTILDSKMGKNDSYSYTNLLDKPTIPTKVSQLDNDEVFITATDVSNSYVAKVVGKDLSTNDYTNLDKQKLSNLFNYNDAEIINALSLKADKQYVDNALANISGGGTAIDLSNYVLKTDMVSPTQDGLMTISQMIKLDTLENYVHPDTHQISMIVGLQTILDSKMGKNDSFSYTNLLDKPTIPSKTSQLDNDIGFITSHQDISTKQDKLVAGNNITISVDNIISANDTTYTNATTTKDGLMPKEDKIKINELVNYDDTSIKALINAKSDTVHTHAKSEVGLGNVDNTSDLDKPISTLTQNALNLKADKAYVDIKLASVYKFKHSIANSAALPTTGMETGDVYNLEDTGENVAWAAWEDGTFGWDNLGMNIDLTGYLTTDNADLKYEIKDTTIVKDSAYVHTDNNFTTNYKTKLDGIAEGANNYVHPISHEISMINGLQTELNGKMSSGAIIDYSSLSNKPTIPTKVSQLDNDSGFVTSALDLSTYATKTYVDSQVSTLNTKIGDISTILASVV